MNKSTCKTLHKSLLYTLSFMMVGVLLYACSPSKYVPEGEQFYLGIKEIKIEDKKGGSHESRAISEMNSTLNTKPNGSLFGSAKFRLPFTYGFYFDRKYENDSTFLGRWLYKAFGDRPIFISTVNPEVHTTVADRILDEFGYFNSSVDYKVWPNKKDSLQAKLGYYVTLGQAYTYDSIDYRLHINTPDSTMLFAPENRLIKKGDYFSITTLEDERQRISDHLRSKGFYFFRPNNIIYKADTVLVPGKVQLRVLLSDKMLPEASEAWRLGSITYHLYDRSASPLTDSIMDNGILYKFHKKMPVRLSVLRPRVHLKIDSLYNLVAQKRTIQQMAVLNTFAYTEVSYNPNDTIRNKLDVTISSQEDKPYFSEFETVFKFKSNEQIGPGLNYTVSKKNVFRGGELLSISTHANYEWETNRSGGGDSWSINSYEFRANVGLTFPRVLLPGLINRQFDYPASTTLQLGAGILNRGKYYTLGQFSGNLKYMFEPSQGLRHTFTPLHLSYNRLLRQTDAFKVALLVNPALTLAFENQFVAGIGYTFGFERIDPETPHNFSLETSINEAGNLMSVFYKKREDDEPNRFLGAPFAQYVKGTLELRYSYRFNEDISLASRLFAGSIISYGNMKVAPYAEQFYVGGANSVRGFNVRSLGPGSYVPVDIDRMSFLDRTGDLRLEANIEYRHKVVGDLELATFIDAGNVWLLREDDHRLGGKITGKTFFNDIALGSGLGVRYDLQYLVVRLDFGVALHAPYKDRKRYFNTFDGQKDWYAVHLAIGYPF